LCPALWTQNPGPSGSCPLVSVFSAMPASDPRVPPFERCFFLFSASSCIAMGLDLPWLLGMEMEPFFPFRFPPGTSFAGPGLVRLLSWHYGQDGTFTRAIPPFSLPTFVSAPYASWRHLMRSGKFLSLYLTPPLFESSIFFPNPPSHPKSVRDLGGPVSCCRLPPDLSTPIAPVTPFFRSTFAAHKPTTPGVPFSPP